MPRAKATRQRSGSESHSLATARARPPMSAARPTLTRNIVPRRSSRSASAPAGRANSSQGSRSATVTTAKAVGSRVMPRVTSGRATWNTPSARLDSPDETTTFTNPAVMAAIVAGMIEKSQSITIPSMATPPDPKTVATHEEFKAMAHPLRLRILRLCLHESLTNKQIADRLAMHPATVLHHVRMLHATGFLQAEEVRRGDRGALEKPYRATGKSWTLSLPRSEDRAVAQLAVLD